MSQKLGDLIKSLATKMKLDLKDEKLKPLFELDTPVDDAHATAFEQNLMTEEAALANSKIRNTIKAESLNGLDAILDELMTDNGFDDATKTEMKTGADTSFKRTKLIAKKIGELQKAKAAAEGGGDKKAIQKQIDELTEALDNEKKGGAKKIEDLTSVHNTDLQNMALIYSLQGKNYYNEDVPKSVHALTAKALLEQSLAKDGAVLVFDKTSQTFKLQNKETKMDFHNAKQQKVTAEEYIDGVLAENKLLKTSHVDPNPKDTIITPGDDKKHVNKSMLSTIDQQLGDLT